MCDGNVMVAHAVLNPAQGTLPVRVMNLSEEPQKVHTGTTIASYAPVSKVSELVSYGEQSKSGSMKHLP